MWITSSLNTVKTPTAIALGNFDGVHRGHRQVIQPILPGPAQPPEVAPNPAEHSLDCLSASDGLEHHHFTCARSLSDQSAESSGSRLHMERSASAPDEGHSGDYPLATVVTFFPHPQEFFTGKPQLLLTPLQEKALQLKSMGVEQLMLIPFNQALAQLTPQEFVEHILIQRLQAKQISVGMDFRFGRQRAGRAEDLAAIASAYGIDVTIVPLKIEQGERISSSAIREALLAGNLQQANHLLGRPYSLTGRIVRGQQLGRTLGFPTANLKLPPEKFIPRYGVYSVWIYLTDADSARKTVPGVMNIGCRPTVDGLQETVEVHLLDWSGDLYGQTITVSLEEFIRPEQKFGSLDALKHQIQADCQVAKARLLVRNRP